MAGSTISGTVAVTVTIGSGAYPGPVTITASGLVDPSAAGANAVYVPAATSHARLFNYGKIVGGYSTDTDTRPGGYGVLAVGRAVIDNTGQILGGSTGYYENAGAGISLKDGGNVTNSGFIAGGSAYYYNNGGVGVDIAGAGQLSNTGTIIGGDGGIDDEYYGEVTGAAGVLTSGLVAIDNAGLIKGGNSGIGVDLGSGGRITNSGIIAGGQYGRYASGGTALVLGDATTLHNSGTIVGATGAQAVDDETWGGGGGVGVLCGGAATLVNSGRIEGGNGGYASGYGGGTGGAGVSLGAGGILHNNGGTITGGAAGVYFGTRGGAGVTAAGGATIFNSGAISGGASDDYTRGAQLIGVAGVSLAAAGIVDNAGTITGGAGGVLAYGTGTGGTGGAGVSLAGMGELQNSGVISGGTGGAIIHTGSGTGGTGGLGVYIDGGTLINAGTITGGAGGFGNVANGAAGTAIQFGTLAATLIVDPGAVFVGDVMANAAMTDILQLAGTTPGTFSGLGTQFTGFTDVKEHAGADWTLTGTNSLSAATQLTDAGALTVTGTLQAAGLTLAGGTLTDAAGATIVLGNDANAQSGSITVAEAATLSGSGTIVGPVVIDGILAAHGGTLTIENSIAGFGTMRIDGDATLVADGSLNVTHIAFGLGGGGDLVLAQPVPTQTPFPTFFGFGTGDKIDLQNLKATSLTFANGTLTLEHGSKILDSLTFSGDYTSANFTLASDHAGGTDILFVATGAPLPDFASTPDSFQSGHVVSSEFWGGSIPALTHYATATTADSLWNTLNHVVT